MSNNLSENPQEIMDQNNDIQEKTFTEKLVELRQKWTEEVIQLNSEMKDLTTVNKLLNVIYGKRQEAVDLYHSTNHVYLNQMMKYKQKYAALYNNFKTGSNGIRYTNETAIQTQIESVLADHRQILDELKNFLDFIWETVKSIDGLQYSISHKIKIHEILNGLKF